MKYAPHIFTLLLKFAQDTYRDANKATMAQSRNHCFTLNNYVAGDIERMLALECDYIIIGKEVGAEGTPHFQGYVEWKTPKRLTTLKKLDERVHWEARKGTAEQAATYCKKGEQTKEEWDKMGEMGPNFGKNAVIFEYGTISKQGKRTDLDTVGAMVVAGAPLAEIAKAHPGTYIKYARGIKELKATLMTHRSTKPTVTWTWGLTGVGKTRSVIEAHPSHYIKDGTKWWDGYEQQEAIIIDDFDSLCWPFRDLLRLLDFYKYQGQIKGGFVPINSKYIHITCEHAPSTLWSGNDLAQVLRRIDKVSHIETPIYTPNH